MALDIGEANWVCSLRQGALPETNTIGVPILDGVGHGILINRRAESVFLSRLAMETVWLRDCRSVLL